jgi:(p)ppGpp synthase/HD superfamily hydrolase
MRSVAYDGITMSQLYADALAWAEQLHRGQRRKGKAIPYLSHLLAVTGLPVVRETE